ncbi:HAAS signaling domain-containing protein [Pedobacter sp. KLB.chiD]|uniref:HAAS signaling domain-containing protein n=1 Tax=Pedobacter sp. KLB.chiD TaxID=3387402 RepID=UPI00399B85DC
MKLKEIPFKDQSAERIYQDYLYRIRKEVKGLNQQNQDEILMELNSHIYENLQEHPTGNEVEKLLNILEKLGRPEEILKPLVADKKLTEATQTFNPIAVFKALLLNLTNGISYIIFFILYLFLFGFVFLIGAKIWNPSQVGFFYKPGEVFIIGLSKGLVNPADEILGNWFIPVMIIVTVALYFMITLLLKLKRTINK